MIEISNIVERVVWLLIHHAFLPFKVCALLWSSEYKELISSHGYALNQLTIWKYPAMTKVSELTGMYIFIIYHRVTTFVHWITALSILKPNLEVLP